MEDFFENLRRQKELDRQAKIEEGRSEVEAEMKKGGATSGETGLKPTSEQIEEARNEMNADLLRQAEEALENGYIERAVSLMKNNSLPVAGSAFADARVQERVMSLFEDYARGLEKGDSMLIDDDIKYLYAMTPENRNSGRVQEICKRALLGLYEKCLYEHPVIEFEAFVPKEIMNDPHVSEQRKKFFDKFDKKRAEIKEHMRALEEESEGLERATTPEERSKVYLKILKRYANTMGLFNETDIEERLTASDSAEYQEFLKGQEIQDKLVHSFGVLVNYIVSGDEDDHKDKDFDYCFNKAEVHIGIMTEDTRNSETAQNLINQLEDFKRSRAA